MYQGSWCVIIQGSWCFRIQGSWCFIIQGSWCFIIQAYNYFYWRVFIFLSGKIKLIFITTMFVVCVLKAYSPANRTQTSEWCEPAWPSGNYGAWLVRGRTQVRLSVLAYRFIYILKNPQRFMDTVSWLCPAQLMVHSSGSHCCVLLPSYAKMSWL